MTSERSDRYGDIVVTNGIDTAEFEQNPVALLCHMSRDWPIGTWSGLNKMLNTRPPRMEGKMTLMPEGGPVDTIDEAAWMLGNNGIRACSIGFAPGWDDVESIRGDDGEWLGLKFNTSELVECSLCCVPANPDALAKGSENAPGIAKELIEDILDNWARSPIGLLIPRAEFEEKWRVVDPESVSRSYIEFSNGTFFKEVDRGLVNGFHKYDREPLTREELLAAADKIQPKAEAIHADKPMDESKFAKSMVKHLAKLFGMEKEAPPTPAPAPVPLTQEQRAAIDARISAASSKLERFL